MPIELLQMLSNIAFGFAGVLLAGTIFLFFYLDIRSTISDLSGVSEQKAINEIRKKNENPTVLLNTHFKNQATGRKSNEKN